MTSQIRIRSSLSRTSVFSAASLAWACLFTVGLVTSPLNCFGGEFSTVEEAAEHPDFAYQGEYVGEVTEDPAVAEQARRTLNTWQ